MTTPTTTPTTPTGGMPVPVGGSVAELNAAREAAATAGKDVYAGNLSSLSSFQAAPVAPAATTPTPIAADKLATPPTPLTAPAAPTPTANLSGATVAGTAAAQNDALIAQQNEKVAADQKAATDSKNTVQQYIDRLLGKGADQAQMEADAGIAGKTQLLTDITNEYNTKQLAFRHAAENAYARAGNEATGAAAVAALDRQNNAELADIAVRQSVAQGNLKTAQDLIDHKIAIKYGDLKDVISYQMQFLQTNEANLTSDQKDKLQLQINKNQQTYQTETEAAKALETQKLTALTQAMELGAPASVQSAIQAATTPEGAIAAAGRFVGGLDAAAKRASIDASRASAANSRANTQKTLAELNGNGTVGYNGDFAATVSLAANTGGTNAQRTQIQTNLQNFLANKDYKSAYAQVLQATGNGLTGTAKTDFNNRNSQLGVTQDLKTALQSLKDAGYDTNKLTGSADHIGTTLGLLAVDPKYAAVANQADLAFQNYRQAMTGAAFGAKESSEYASVLPGKGNTFSLNMTKIDGLDNYLNSVVDSYTGQIVGQGGKEIRQYAQGATPAAPAATGPSVTVGGQTYVVGSILQNALGQKAKVNADGTVSPI